MMSVKNKLIGIILYLGCGFAFADAILPKQFVNPPEIEKKLNDYSIKEVYSCLLIKPSSLPSSHPFITGGMNSLKKQWKLANDEKVVHDIIKYMTSQISGLDLKGNGAIGIKKRLILACRLLLRDGIHISQNKQIEIIKKILSEEKVVKKKRVLVDFLVEANRDWLDYGILKILSAWVHDKSYGEELFVEEIEEPVDVIYYGDIVMSGLERMIGDSFKMNNKTPKKKEAFILWVKQNETLFIRQKKNIFKSPAYNKEEIEIRGWVPRRK